ncbi:hypothetical protein EV199_3450 [Pseudobacter ginsenosidimutans]|uniref:Uncharacterized protein n=1 Tax=Pseudobacter ginsenosidimutans TaxID=661488 RepID=A0A4Q7MS05_9BACT|nr:hypothetical protein EV199_3450 [Pseudobacter ginsenosidimutans]
MRENPGQNRQDKGCGSAKDVQRGCEIYRRGRMFFELLQGEMELGNMFRTASLIFRRPLMHIPLPYFPDSAAVSPDIFPAYIFPKQFSNKNLVFSTLSQFLFITKHPLTLSFHVSNSFQKPFIPFFSIAIWYILIYHSKYSHSIISHLKHQANSESSVFISIRTNAPAATLPARGMKKRPLKHKRYSSVDLQ